MDAFIDDIEQRHGIRLDWVYEAKMMFALFDLIEHDEFHRGTTIMR